MKKYAASEVAVAVIGEKVLDSYDGVVDRWHFKKYPDLKVCIRGKKQDGYPILKCIDNNINYYYWDSRYAFDNPQYGYELPLTDFIKCKITYKFTIDELLEIQDMINGKDKIENEQNIFKLLEKIYQSILKNDNIDKLENLLQEYLLYTQDVFNSLTILKQYKSTKEVKSRYKELIEEGILLYHKVNRQSNIKEESLQRKRK